MAGIPIRNFTSAAGGVFYNAGVPYDANGALLVANPYDMTTLREALIAFAKQRTGSSNVKLICVGDSTTAGLPGDGNYTGRTTSYPTVLNSILGTLGQTAKLNSCLIDPTGSFNNTNFTTYDARWTLGANWSTSNYGTNYQRYLVFNNATPANATFTPATSCDTYEVYYVSNPAYGTLTIGSTGASPSTINMAAATATRKATITVTAGQPLILTPPVSTQVNISAVVGYTAATKEISVINAGQGGARSSFWSDRTQVYSNSYLLDTIDADLALICLGINDWLNGVSVSTYKSNMQSIISNFVANSTNCVLISPFPSAISNVALATQRGFRDALAQLAATNNVPFVDVFSMVGSYEIAQPMGYYQSAQTVHPSVAGYNMLGYAVAGAVGELFT